MGHQVGLITRRSDRGGSGPSTSAMPAVGMPGARGTPVMPRYSMPSFGLGHVQARERLAVA